ncbi:MAG: UDP-N-acetylmuramoyl-tripeptide--D-alanyl-D-alanine ligase, partial [Actinomycetes bacterium]
LDLGGAARDRLADRVVGITGSVGKTSTKDLTAAALATRWKVTASAQSFNNELGVPLTLANASPDTDVTVVEMGARGPGHIALLCGVARPTVAVVTAVAAVHTEFFGDLRSVARSKGELVEALPADGTAVLNADDPAVAAMAERTDAAVVSYGLRPGADVVATEVRLDADLRPTFMLRSPWGTVEVRPAVRGEHQVANTLAAAAVALTWDVPLAAVADGLARAEVSPWRMQLEHTAGGAAVLNDAYNANPTSMAAALRALAALDARRRVAVIGEMAELCPIAADEHRRIAALASELGIQVVAVGTSLYGPGAVAGPAQAAAVLGPLGPDDAVLVKASRVAGLERLAELLCRAGP